MKNRSVGISTMAYREYKEIVGEAVKNEIVGGERVIDQLSIDEVLARLDALIDASIDANIDISKRRIYVGGELYKRLSEAGVKNIEEIPCEIGEFTGFTVYESRIEDTPIKKNLTKPYWRRGRW